MLSIKLHVYSQRHMHNLFFVVVFLGGGGGGGGGGGLCVSG